MRETAEPLPYLEISNKSFHVICREQVQPNVVAVVIFNFLFLVYILYLNPIRLFQ